MDTNLVFRSLVKAAKWPGIELYRHPQGHSLVKAAKWPGIGFNIRYTDTPWTLTLCFVH